MKKIILLAMIFPLLSFGQDERKTTISAFTAISEPTQIGLSLEHQLNIFEKPTNLIFNLSFGGITLETPVTDIDGFGFVVEYGSRKYFSKNEKGFYYENFLTYGNIKFDEDFAGLGKFEGTYSYWSLINSNVGYKIYIGSGFVIDPSIGCNWKWEVKGKGDIDNKDFDNLVFRVGLKLGYSF